MNTRFLIIIVFTLILTASLIVVSQWGTIQKELWYMTGEYSRGSVLIPSIDYDYSMMYVVVLVGFGIIGSILFGINIIIWRKRTCKLDF